MKNDDWLGGGFLVEPPTWKIMRKSNWIIWPWRCQKSLQPPAYQLCWSSKWRFFGGWQMPSWRIFSSWTSGFNRVIRYKSHHLRLVSWNLTHTIYVWSIYLHGWLIFTVNVGKYTSPIDAMGYYAIFLFSDCTPQISQKWWLMPDLYNSWWPSLHQMNSHRNPPNLPCVLSRKLAPIHTGWAQKPVINALITPTSISRGSNTTSCPFIRPFVGVITPFVGSLIPNIRTNSLRNAPFQSGSRAQFVGNKWWKIDSI